jgi:hypothetical protein
MLGAYLSTEKFSDKYYCTDFAGGLAYRNLQGVLPVCMPLVRAGSPKISLDENQLNP